MINLSIQNFIAFLVQPLFPSGLRRSKEKGRLKLSRTLQGLPGYKSLFMAPVSFFTLIFIYLFLAALDLRCCARAFSSCGERGLLFVAVRGLLIAVASLVAEHGL